MALTAHNPRFITFWNAASRWAAFFVCNHRLIGKIIRPIQRKLL
jgi:hypothetical protein